MLTLSTTSAAKFRTICPKCQERVEFVLFQASSYNYATHFGTASKSYYRLDLDACAYLKFDPDEMLRPAIDAEQPQGQLLTLPDQVWCPQCEVSFAGPEPPLPVIGESSISAVLLPSDAA